MDCSGQNLTTACLSARLRNRATTARDCEKIAVAYHDEADESVCATRKVERSNVAERSNLKVSTMPTPLIEGRNIGPVTAREFERLGIYTVEQLRELGWKEACLLWVERFPSRINLNAFRSVAGAVYGVDYNQIPPDEDAEAERTAVELRRAAQALKRAASYGTNPEPIGPANSASALWNPTRRFTQPGRSAEAPR